MNKHRILTYFLGILLIIVFLARLVQTYSYLGYGFVQMGILSDKICARGSYEIIICLPDILPPYETILTLIAILLIFSLWFPTRKKNGSYSRPNLGPSNAWTPSR